MSCRLLTLFMRAVRGGSGPATYSISGDIVDGADAGIEGVLVTLSGDADDTDTTDANGHYEFTGLVDGSYTVTPTLANLQMTPASRAANVSGDDVAVDDIVGQYLILPYTFNTSDIVGGANGDVLSSLDSRWHDRTGYEKWKVTTNSLAGAGGYTPPGLTRQAYAYGPDGGATAEYGRHLLPYPVEPIPIVRWAILGRTTQGNRGGPFAGLHLEDDIDSWSSLAWGVIAKSTAGPPAAYLSTLHYEGGTPSDVMSWASMSSSGAGGAITTGDATYWMWLGFELNYTAHTVTARVWKPDDASNKYSYKTQAMNANGQTKSLCQPFNVTQFGQTASDASLYVFFAKYWIGTGDDAWPT